MRKRHAILLVLCALGVSAFRADAADSFEQIRTKGLLVAGVKYGVPPFGFVDRATGELVGYDVDVVRAIAAKLGVRLELRPVDQKNRIRELIEGHVDLLAANLSPNPDTGKVVDFSDTYLITGVGFLTKKGTVASLGDLAGKKIAVSAGSVSEEAVRATIPNAKTVPFDNRRDAIQALREGAVDAGAGDTSILPALIGLLPAGQYEIPPIQIAEIPYALGVRKGDQAFVDFLNRTLAEMERSGEAKRIFDKWFQPRASAGQGAAQIAAGAVVRKASARPGVVVLILDGTFVRGAEVSMYSINGDFVCKGTVTNVFEDQIYVDTDPAQCDAVRPGYAVATGANEEMIRGAVQKHQGILRSVQEQARKEQESYVQQREKDGIEKQKRAEEADQKAYESKLRVEEERATNEDYYYYEFRNYNR